jgi:hypothetical protein
VTCNRTTREEFSNGTKKGSRGLTARATKPEVWALFHLDSLKGENRISKCHFLILGSPRIYVFLIGGTFACLVRIRNRLKNGIAIC